MYTHLCSRTKKEVPGRATVEGTSPTQLRRCDTFTPPMPLQDAMSEIMGGPRACHEYVMNTAHGGTKEACRVLVLGPACRP
jgi:hypothetical protein